MIHKHSTYKTDKQTITVRKGKILVEMEPFDTVSKGGIHYSANGIEDVKATAIIRAFGFERNEKTHKEWPIEGIAVGDRVMLVRYHSETHTNICVQGLIGDNLVLIERKDIIGVIDGE